MGRTTILSRLCRADRRDVADFAEAVVALLVASAAIKLLPFRTVVRTMHWGPPGRMPSTNHGRDMANGVGRAVRRAAARLPCTVVCLPLGLAAHWMLRRRGAASLVHYGLRQSESELTAHVWVTLDNKVVVGEEASDVHAVVAVFPARS